MIQIRNRSLYQHLKYARSPPKASLDNTKLILLDPRSNPSNNQHRSNKDRPKPNPQRRYIITRLRRGSNGRQLQKEDNITAQSMPLVDFLPVINTAEYCDGHEELGDAHNDLQKEADVGDEPEDAVDRGEACFRVGTLVDFDDGEGCDEGEVGEGDEDEVDVGSEAFLRGSLSRLEDEDCLRGEKDCG